MPKEMYLFSLVSKLQRGVFAPEYPVIYYIFFQ